MLFYFKPILHKAITILYEGRLRMDELKSPSVSMEKIRYTTPIFGIPMGARRVFPHCVFALYLYFHAFDLIA
jgi:hypothetical protein